MVVFKKTCFECGAKVDNLYQGKCENCILETQPPILEIKPVTFKIDNKSKDIFYGSSFFKQEKIKEMLPDIMKKRVIINDFYILNDLWIENFQIKGNRIIFDVCVDCALK